MGQPITVVKEGQRIYFAGDTYAAKDRIKSMGGHWDAESRRWWVGAKKLALAEALAAESAAPTVPRAAASVGLSPDAPAYMVEDKLREKGQDREADAVARGRDLEDPDKIRLDGKCTYKGKSYFMGSTAVNGSRVRLLTLPDREGKFLDFWADSRDVEVVKRYEPREERGAYGKRTGRYEYTTLGSIARFVSRQERERQAGTPACPVCGKRGPLVHDLEDGLDKCFGCCDMPQS